MSQRKAYLDVGIGETRGVVTVDGHPERLFIARDGDDPFDAPGGPAELPNCVNERDFSTS